LDARQVAQRVTADLLRARRRWRKEQKQPDDEEDREAVAKEESRSHLQGKREHVSEEKETLLMPKGLS
jgi:hypothetical protein